MHGKPSLPASVVASGRRKARHIERFRRRIVGGQESRSPVNKNDACVLAQSDQSALWGGLSAMYYKCLRIFIANFPRHRRPQRPTNSPQVSLHHVTAASIATALVQSATLVMASVLTVMQQLLKHCRLPAVFSSRDRSESSAVRRALLRILLRNDRWACTLAESSCDRLRTSALATGRETSVCLTLQHGRLCVCRLDGCAVQSAGSWQPYRPYSKDQQHISVKLAQRICERKQSTPWWLHVKPHKATRVAEGVAMVYKW